MKREGYLQEPPDGGWGWLIVIGGMYCLAMWGGITRCYSVFFSPLMSDFEADYGSVAWLNGMFQAVYGICTVVGPLLMQKFERRPMCLISSFLCGISCFLASFCQQLWAVQVLMAMLVGAGMGIISISVFTTTTRYFKKRLHMANQLLCLGISAGPLLVCPGYQYLITTYGWRGACRIVAGLFLNMTVASALLRPIKLMSDLETPEHLPSTEKYKDKHSSESEEKSKPKRLFDLTSLDAEIVGSQSLGLYTPPVARRNYDVNDNITKSHNRKDEKPISLSSNSSNKLSNSTDENCGTKFKNFCIKYDLTLFTQKRFYLYTLSWTTFAAAFFSASTYIIPYGKSVAGLTEFEASTLVSAFAGGEIFSRIAYAFLFDKIPLKFRILYVSALYAVFSIAILVFPFIRGYIGALICCACIGALGGGTDGIFSAFIAEIFSVQQYAFVFGYSNIITHSTGTATTVLIGVAVDRLQNLSVPFYIGFGAAVTSSILVFLLHKTVMKIRKEKVLLEADDVFLPLKS
ncbi:monocarboxylate transporter 7-like [Styela clava]